MKDLPLVAYRGLWDKFALPGSLGAIRRAYLRGVACVLHGDSKRNDAEVLRLVDDPSINRRGRPLFRVDADEDWSRPQPLSRWHEGQWHGCGVYVPALAGEDLKSALDAAAKAFSNPTVLVESANVLGARRAARAVDAAEETAAFGRVLALVSGAATVGLVSDLVELDQLRRQQEMH